MHWLKDPAAYRAVNPSGDLSVAKSDFKHSNLILSVVYMVVHCSFPKTCQMSSMNGCRKSDVVHPKKTVKSVSTRITSKCCEGSISQPINWKIFSVPTCLFSFVDVTLQIDRLFNVVHSATGNRKVPRMVSILTVVTNKKQNWSFLPVRRQLKLLLRSLRTSLLLLCLTSPNAQHFLCHTRVIGVF